MIINSLGDAAVFMGNQAKIAYTYEIARQASPSRKLTLGNSQRASDPKWRINFA